MLHKKFTLVLLGAASFALGSSAFAEHEGGGALKVGFQYNASLNHDNHGLMKVSGAKDPTKTTQFMLNAAKITGSGEAAKDVSYHARYDILNSAVEIANATWKHSDMMSLTVGRDKVNQGGYENKHAGYSEVGPRNAYAHNMAFADYEDMLSLKFAVAGALTVQLANNKLAKCTTDTSVTPNVTTCDGRKADAHTQPGLTIEWTGDFSGWAPLVQLGSYDLGKSMSLGLGVEGKVAGLGLAVDFTNDSRNYADAASGKEAKDTLTAMNVHVDYALSGFTPWLEYKSYNSKEGSIGTTRKDGKVNATPGAATTVEDAFGDNGTAYGVGANCNAFGNGYVPYFALVSHSGKFAKATTGEESRSNMMVKLGVFGAF